MTPVRWVLAFLLATVPCRAAFAQATRSAVAQTPDDALAAYRSGGIQPFVKQVEATLRQELAKKKPVDAVVVQCAALRAFASRLAGAKLAESEAKTLEWLVSHSTLGPALLTALSERDDPKRVLGVLTALRDRYPKAVEQYPELTVATCVVWDAPNREGQTPEQATAAGREVFGHLVENRKAFRFDSLDLPWPVLVYLVDARATREERQWAITRFRLPPEPGRAYFAIRYDLGGFASGVFRGGAGKENYTLANILRFGGVCKDQAYFAAEACRANGIPAVVCTGQSSGGEGFHAWIGLLRVGRNRAEWDFQTGRYAEHGFWSGVVIDPQTGEKLGDGDVSMVAEWCGTTRDKRWLSLALTASLDLVDPAARVPLCKQAIEAAPGNQAAWMALAKECTRAETPIELLREVGAVVERFAVGRYDDFAFKFYLALIAGRSPEEQITALDRAANLFHTRPDLLAELALRRGDVLVALKRPLDAMRLYEKVLDEAIAYGPLALDAMARLESLLRPAGHTKELLRHYQRAWSRMTVPKPSGYAWTTPWYIMGERYAKTLEEAGDREGANRVRGTIRAKDQSRRDGRD